MTLPEQQSNPWDLEGDGFRFEGHRTSRSEQWVSAEFTLEQGVVMFRVEHDGDGPCIIKLARVSPGFFDNDLALFEFQGAIWSEMAWVVTPGEWRAPRPDEEYQLVVEADGDWQVLMLQPELGQASTTMPFHTEGESGVHLLGPVRNPGRPLLVKGQHSARGPFYAQILPLDGSHEEQNFIEIDGQTYVEDHPTEMMAGKEYLIEVGASGRWELEFYEGY